MKVYTITQDELAELGGWAPGGGRAAGTEDGNVSRPGWEFELYNDDIAGDDGAGYYVFCFTESTVKSPISGLVCPDAHTGGWAGYVVMDSANDDIEVINEEVATLCQAQLAVERFLLDMLDKCRRQLLESPDVRR